jgi:CRP-like cAMP-binding protein
MDIFKDFLVSKLDFKDIQLKQLEQVVDVVKLEKKDYLINAGSVCRFIGFIENGVLRSYIQKESNEFNVDFYLTGSFVSSYTSFLTQQPTNTNIQALSNSTIYTISYSNYSNLLKTNTEWYKLSKLIADTLFIKKCQREKSLLMDSAEDRYNLLLKTYPQIEQVVAQYHIASYLGIKPESLSRIKSLTYINK